MIASPLRISVALCTYNGATYLEEQLASFTVQTLLPFELIVCDDLSTDATANIVENFAKQSPFPVHFYRNPSCLGSTLNFDRAISLCNGEYVALADQDDVWRTDKLERISQVLAIEGVVAAFSDAEVTDEALLPLGYRMWQRLAFGKKEQKLIETGHALDVLLKRYVVMGATLVFRSDLRQLILPIPHDWHHDAWIAIVAATAGEIGLDSSALVKYRQHVKNQIGGRKISFFSQLRNAIKVDRDAYLKDELVRWSTIYERLHEMPNAKTLRLEAKVMHLKKRINFPHSRWHRLICVMNEVRLGGYARYARNWGSIALDLLIK